MAPNRKSVTSIVESLSNADLQSLVNPKFLPLTNPREEEQESQHEVVTRPENQSTASASYWDWPSQEPTTTEEIHVLSCDNIVSNLIQATDSNASSESISSANQKSETLAENDAYWAEGESDTASRSQSQSQPQHDDYWDWHEEHDSKRKLLEEILEEEKARHLVSGDFMVEAVKKNVASDAAQVCRCRSSSDPYWKWESPKTSSYGHRVHDYWNWDRRCKPSPLDSLLEYEAARQILSSDNIATNLKFHHEMMETTSKSDTTRPESDDYWMWSEHLGDSYWDTPATQVLTTGYWDW